MLNPAQADELKFPDYAECNPPELEGTHACFSLAGMKVLLKIDEKRLSLQKINKDLRQIVEKKDFIIKNKEDQIKLLNESLSISKEASDRWFHLWEDENKKRHKAENEPRLGEYIGWGAAGVFAVTSVVLGTLVVEDRVF